MSRVLIIFITVVLYYAKAQPIDSSSISSSASAVSSISPQFSYEDQMEAIVKEMTDCMDHKLSPIMSKLSKADEAQFKDIGVAGLSSYIEHLFELLKEENESQKKE